jgi:hypothetical protein
MAAKPRMGKLLFFPLPGKVVETRAQVQRASSEMIAAEHALFVALRLAHTRANSNGDHPPIQPPPRTSSSRKKTAA